MALDAAPGGGDFGAGGQTGAVDTAPAADAPSAAPATAPESAPASDSARGESSPGAARAPAAPPPQVQQIQAQYGQLLALEQQLAAQEQQDLQLAQYGEQLPPALRAQIQQRYPAYAVAREKLAIAKAAAELEFQRSQLEGPARQLTHARHVAAARQLDPGVDAQAMDAFLSRFSSPEDVAAAAQAYLELRRDAGTSKRVANGTDRMGGPGGAAAANWGNLSESQLYEIGIEQSDRRSKRR